MITLDEELRLIGRRVKLIRMERKIGQTVLAKKMGLSQTNLSNMENGRTAVTIQNLLKLRKILNCSMNDFFVDFEQSSNEKMVEGSTTINLDDAVRILKLLKAIDVDGL